MTLHAMHLAAWLCSRVKFICRDRGGLPGGLLLVLADCRPVRGEAVRRGSDNGCYGKSVSAVDIKKAARLAACCYFLGFPASERFPLTLPSLLRSRG